MTRFMLTAAALAVATPVLADQPVTPLEVRKHFAADDSGNEAVVFEGGTGITPRAAELHAQIARNDDSDNVAVAPTARELLQTEDSIVNERAARIFKQLAAEDPTS